MRRLACALLLAPGLAPAHIAYAQRVFGRVTEADGRTGITGVLLTLVQDSTATPAVLSAPDGRFLLRASGAGTWRVKAQAVGRAPQLSRLLVLGAQDTARVELRFPPFVPTLEAVRAAAPGTCRDRPDDDDRAREVWDAIRTAFEASAATERERRTPLELEVTDYRLDVLKQRTSAMKLTLRSWSGAGFLSTAPDELVTRGYVRQVGDSVAYFAPDAAVITSPSFLATHCFRVDERRALFGARELGLAFQPLPSRTVGDVRGTLWLDPRSAALKRLELEYVVPGRTSSLPNADATIDYARLPNGRWFVSRWLLNMPVVREVGPAVGGVSSVAFSGWRSREGVARAISLRDAARLAPSAVIAGRAYDSLAMRPLVATRVRLAGAGEATTDSAGAFTMTVNDPLSVPSPATLTVEAPMLARLGIDSPTREVPVIPGDTTRVEMAIPNARAVRSILCPTLADTGAGASALVGSVPRGDGGTSGVSDSIMVSWYLDSGVKESLRSAVVVGARIGDGAKFVSARVGPDGRFVACGVPVGIKLTVAWPASADHPRGVRGAITIQPGTIGELRLDPAPGPAPPR
ncbi:MAG: carboxypeptidase regulatory-like domain-containing protein [Gemmatimonadetes bacterium]|nr:carboxypeptidase regulatory-like domain-containing protein [Gemmatimonadota bacterium]